MKPATGELHLTLARRGERTVAVGQRHAGTLQTLRPLYLDDSGQVCYYVVNPGGGALRDDRYLIDVEVQQRASVLLTTQSATKVYRTPGTAATQDMRIILEAGAILEYVPDQLILYCGASYRQACIVEMDAEATLMMAEIVTPGWSPDGTPFRYDELRMRTEIHYGGALLAVDNVLIEPGVDAPGQIGSLDGRTHFGSMTVVDRRVDRELLDDIWAIVDTVDGVHSGIAELAGPGMVIRCLGDDTGAIARTFAAVSTALRARWTGQSPLELRKY